MSIIEAFNHADHGAGRDISDRAPLRLVTLEDLPTLEVLEKEVFRDLAYSVDLLRVFYNLYRTTWFVAERGDDLAGYALVGLSSDSLDGWLLGLATSHRHRGQGLGKQLMSRALISMMDHDITNAYLTVRPDNEAARKIYNDFDFVQDGEPVANYYGNGEPRDVLHRSLKKNPYYAESR